MSTQSRAPEPSDRQAGMVAIMVTLILMLVISLIVIGFAQISRRNQRESLDRQLSTQAFYAAETGVNDATKLMTTAIAAGATVSAKPDCASDGGGFYTSLNPIIDAANNVAYTCVTVDNMPSSIFKNPVSSTSTVFALTSSSGTFSKLEFKWQNTDGSSTPANNCPTTWGSAFTPVASWTCSYGVLRFDLVPTDGAALGTASLQSNTMTTFVVPLRPGSASPDGAIQAFATGGAKDILAIICSNSNCDLQITGLTNAHYYLRISSIYKPVALEITGTDTLGAPVNFVGAQAIIDATGKAQDVLRRIQVRVPLAGSVSNQMGDYGVQSTDAICKRFSVMDGFFQSDANNAVPGVSGSTTNPLCQ